MTDTTPKASSTELVKEDSFIAPPPAHIEDFTAAITEDAVADRIKEYQSEKKMPKKIPTWYAPFLVALAQKPVVTRACLMARIKSTKTAYRHRNLYAGFAELWDEAIEISYDSLESETWDAARWDNSLKKFLLTMRYAKKKEAMSGSGLLTEGSADIEFTLVIDDDYDEEREEA